MHEFAQNHGSEEKVLFVRKAASIRRCTDSALKIGRVKLQPCESTLPETNKSQLKMDGWKTILSFWVPAYFQGLSLLVSGKVTPVVIGSFHREFVLSIHVSNSDGGWVEQRFVDAFLKGKMNPKCLRTFFQQMGGHQKKQIYSILTYRFF